MGSSASKASRAAGTASRKYPTRAPPTSQPQPQPASSAYPPPPPAQSRQPGPTVRPQAHASGTRDEAINLDASDPDFARSLRSLGPVQPNPTLSPSSAFPHPGNPNNPSHDPRPLGPDPRKNPAIMVLNSRARLQDEADLEFQQAGRRGHEGRQFLDVYMIRQILVERDVKGRSAAEIEKKMGLRKGVVERLGARGVVGVAQEQGRAEKGVHIV
ncbi:hypothetical protein LTR15_009934 [Elasticomyces elasticus]|nr:hypothetical protein LTR15_009934 [Elasticomyces elasticus]